LSTASDLFQPNRTLGLSSFLRGCAVAHRMDAKWTLFPLMLVCNTHLYHCQSPKGSVQRASFVLPARPPATSILRSVGPHRDGSRATIYTSLVVRSQKYTRRSMCGRTLFSNVTIFSCQLDTCNFDYGRHMTRWTPCPCPRHY